MSSMQLARCPRCVRHLQLHHQQFPLPRPSWRRLQHTSSSPSTTSSSAVSRVVARESTAKSQVIEALPFINSAYEIAPRLRAAAVQSLLADEGASLSLRLTYWVTKWLPFAFLRNMLEDDLVQLEKITAFYLPIWVVDAIIKAKTTGSKGEADTTLIFEHCRFPGHAWKEMDSLPINAINENFLHTAPASVRQNENFKAHYQLWDPARHLQPDGVDLGLAGLEDNSSRGEVAGDEENEKSADDSMSNSSPVKALELPFSVSPLHLISLLKTASVETLTTSASTPKSSQPTISVKSPFNGSREVAILQPSPRDLSELDLVGEGEQFKLDAGTVQVEMLAAYPVQVPLYMAEFSYETTPSATSIRGREGAAGPDATRKTILLASSGHDLIGTEVAKASGRDGKWQVKSIRNGPAQLRGIDFFPEPPFASPLTASVSSASDSSSQGEKEDKARSTETLKEAVVLKSIEMVGSLGLAGFNIMLKLHALLDAADWAPLKRLDRQDWQDRVQREAAAASSLAAGKQQQQNEKKKKTTQEDDARMSVPTVSPNSDHIHWSNPCVQRYSHSAWSNRKYSRAYLEFLEARRMVWSMEQARENGSEEFVFVTPTDEADPKGKKQMESPKQHLIRALEKRDRARPKWLQDASA